MNDLRPNTRFDLHLHTDLSDGELPATELLRRCVAGGLEVVALTDHDLVAAVRPGTHEVGGRKIHVITGAEISTNHEGREFHLLVYFPGEVPQRFLDACRAACKARAVRYERVVEATGLGGVAPPDELARRGERALTRTHLARALVKAGHAVSRRDAFDRYLSDKSGNVPKTPLKMTHAIALARNCGGLTSWAHPPVDAVERHIGSLVAAGLHGIEGLRPHTNSRDRNYFRRVAKRHSLFLTGGSDFHGWADPDPGLFCVRASQIGGFVDALRAA
jgi:3',5'-nucleoside bisphosphate phosphatase